MSHKGILGRKNNYEKFFQKLTGCKPYHKKMLQIKLSWHVLRLENMHMQSPSGPLESISKFIKSKNFDNEGSQECFTDKVCSPKIDVSQIISNKIYLVCFQGENYVFGSRGHLGQLQGLKLKKVIVPQSNVNQTTNPLTL